MNTAVAAIARLIQNPATYFSPYGTQVNWIYGVVVGSASHKASNKLWGYPPTSDNSLPLDKQFIGKTIYDPCPEGFCMPPQEIYTNFTTSSSEYNTSTPGHFNSPANEKELLLIIILMHLTTGVLFI